MSLPSTTHFAHYECVISFYRAKAIVAYIGCNIGASLCGSDFMLPAPKVLWMTTGDRCYPVKMKVKILDVSQTAPSLDCQQNCQQTALKKCARVVTEFA